VNNPGNPQAEARPATLNRRWHRALLYLGAGLTLHPHLLGEPSGRDLTDLSLDDLLEVKVHTVTAADRRPQAVSEAPSAVTIIGSDEIDKLGYRNLGEILAGTRGFYVTYDRNYSYLGVRGFGRPGDYNSRVLTMVNGQRLNDNVTGGVLIGSESFIDTELIDRVEIVRGPGSALYGSSALFGVVNVVTKTGKDIQGATATVTGGSFDTYKGVATVGYEFKNGVDFLMSGTVLESAGHENLSFPTFRQIPLSDGIARNTDGESLRSLFSHLSWNGLTLEGGWRDRSKQIPTASYDTIFNDPQNRTIDGDFYGRLSLEHDFENEITVAASVSYSGNYYEGTYIYPDDLPGALPGSTYRLKDDVRGRWWTEDLSLSRTWWESVSTRVGFEARQNLKQDQYTYRETPFISQLDSHQSSATWGPYVDASWALRTNITLAAGARYDRGDFEGSAISPRASLIYAPVPGTTTKFLYGQAFRGPNAFERFYANNGITQKGNPNLKPEKIETFEAVVEQDLGSHFRGTAATYTYYIDDLINQITDPTDHLLVYENLARTRGQGVELELQGHFAHGLRGRISYAIQQTIDEGTRQRLGNSPRNILQGNLIVPIYKESVFSGFEMRYISARTSDSGAGVAPYWIANLTLFSHRWANGLEVSASIYNLFAKRYFDPSPNEIRQPLIEQDGRTFRVRVSYGF